MKSRCLYAWVLFSILLFESCNQGPPILNSISPNVAVPRQIVSVQGSSLGLTAVQWDPGLTSQQWANPSYFTTNYFQIPASATVGSHTVRLSNMGGYSQNSANVTVNSLLGSWPPPRIEDMTYRSYSIDATANTITMLLYISVANVDATALVSIDGKPHESFLYSAITSDYFSHHQANTYKYPIYHYGQLITNLTEQFGKSVTITVQNTDGATATSTFNLPADQNSLDSDNDGLLDTWEINGYPAPSGKIIDLKSMGCDPYRKDILVEVDWMKPDPMGNKAEPNSTIWNSIEAVYGDAPVLNPDGSQGISIHIDHGQDRGISGGVFTNGGSLLDYHYAMDFPETLSNSGVTDYISFYDYKNNKCYK